MIVETIVPIQSTAEVRTVPTFVRKEERVEASCEINSNLENLYHGQSRRYLSERFDHPAHKAEQDKPKEIDHGIRRKEIRDGREHGCEKFRHLRHERIRPPSSLKKPRINNAKNTADAIHAQSSPARPGTSCVSVRRTLPSDAYSVTVCVRG